MALKMINQNHPSPKRFITDYGLRPKKSFGQNFMVDQHINQIFASSVAAFGEENVIAEIGAGTGSLTRHLLSISPLVHAIERDRDLIPVLNEQFRSFLEEGHLILHEADGARFNLSSVFSVDRPGVLVGNLPYHLTSSILLLALRQRRHLKGAVFLVQKEVADRIIADPHSKVYGFLTVILKLAFDIKKITNVDKSAFWPIPKVDSAIIRLTSADHGISQVDDIEKLIVFVREIFQKRRKKLSTILSGVLNKEALLRLNIDPDLRPENLQPGQFLSLYLSTKSI